MAERCLQQITGSCGGCPVQELVQAQAVTEYQRANVGEPRADVNAIAKRVAKTLCPEKTVMQTPTVTHSVIW
ncbi:hypothetical protein HY024_02755 [Candidatus Curtissbacteria bacterium]|nr:hypothetical protein [Candidatus Curtissbacteria bacterium]